MKKSSRKGRRWILIRISEGGVKNRDALKGGEEEKEGGRSMNEREGEVEGRKEGTYKR